MTPPAVLIKASIPTQVGRSDAQQAVQREAPRPGQSQSRRHGDVRHRQFPAAFGDPDRLVPVRLAHRHGHGSKGCDWPEGVEEAQRRQQATNHF